MATEFKIVIPSAGRANTICSHLYINHCIACVPEKEKKSYQEHNPLLEVISHPPIKGIGMKREWIYKKFGNVFMMDDDLKGLKRMHQKAKDKQEVDREAAYWIIQSLGNLAQLTGAYLFGFNNFVRPEHYHGHFPYKLTGYINGCGMGLVKGAKKLRFNPDIKTNNDFFICGLNAFHYRKCFIDKRFCFAQDSFANNIGGCADVRTNEVERKDYELLRSFFGAAVKKKTAGNTAAKHEFSKTLEIPF